MIVSKSVQTAILNAAEAHLKAFRDQMLAEYPELDIILEDVELVPDSDWFKYGVCVYEKSQRGVEDDEEPRFRQFVTKPFMTK